MAKKRKLLTGRISGFYCKNWISHIIVFFCRLPRVFTNAFHFGSSPYSTEKLYLKLLLFESESSSLKEELMFGNFVCISVI